MSGIHVHRALVRLLWSRFHPDAGLAGMPVGWIHGEHGTRVLISHQSAALPDEACARLSRLTNGGGDEFPQWLPPAAPYEQPVRDEDLEFVTKHLSVRAVGKPPRA